MTFIDISGCVLSNINSKKLQGLDFFSQFFLQCRYLKCAPYFGSSLLFSSVFGLVLNFFGELLLFSVSVESGTNEFVSDKGQDDGDGDLFLFFNVFSILLFSRPDQALLSLLLLLCESLWSILEQCLPTHLLLHHCFHR